MPAFILTPGGVIAGCGFIFILSGVNDATGVAKFDIICCGPAGGSEML
jgi:hypothetical protein